jgi:rubrerythrin
MSLRFNADEILEVALDIERNGAAFYREAATLQQAESAKAMLLELAAMEEDHEQTFKQMREGLTQTERQEMSYDPEGELPLYLQVMADKGVFDKKAEPAKKLSGRESLQQVLKLALGMEKDSVLFYLGLQELVPAHLGGERVEAILKEEMSHITALGELLRCA